MAQLQYQEQEDLRTDIHSPTQKVGSLPINVCLTRSDKKGRSNSENEISDPSLLSSPCNFNESPELIEKSAYVVNSATRIDDNIEEWLEAMKLVSGVSAFDIGIESFANVVSKISMILFPTLVKIAEEIPQLEVEWKFCASMALICYGGSWTSLAGIIGALEIFGTKKVLEEIFALVMAFFYTDLEKDCLSPSQMKAEIRKLGLHIALLIATLVSASWAEICITLAFASKYTSLIPVQKFLKKTVSKPVTVRSQGVDASWFELMSVIACNILSFILFGCFPRLITAMYMGYIGVSLMQEVVKDYLSYLPLIWNSEISEESFLMTKSTQYAEWGVVTFMAIWQSVSENTGFFVFLSWLMFLYPIVKVYNLVASKFDFDETNRTKGWQ